MPGLLAGAAFGQDDATEQAYLQSQPVVLTASRLSQPLSESPNAMTVIDQDMIVASGFRSIPDLFKLVPGMYVSYYKGSQAIVSYHGATDQFSRRMQVMIDGRSVYLPPNNTVDWANLPITVDDIQRIEVIRGPAAAAYGANSTQGVINIITKDASGVNPNTVKYTRGSKGINDGHASFGSWGEKFDYRMSLGYTADNGYDNLTSDPRNHTSPPNPGLLNNGNDSNQARLLNYQGSYRPDTANSLDLRFGYNHDIQGVGFNDKNPTATNPTGTNGNPFHDLIASSGFVQIGWTHQFSEASEFNARYYHIQENQHEALPVFLRGIYFPGPVVQTLDVTRDQFDLQHALSTSDRNRLVYGTSYQRNQINGQSIMPPLALNLSSAFTNENWQLFAHDEWHLTRELLTNVGGMLERDYLGNQNFSPRLSVNYHLTPEDTIRTGISVAYRSPALTEMYFPSVQPGALIVPGSTLTSPHLAPEKMISREIGYIGESARWGTLADLRYYVDQLNNGIVLNPVKLDFENTFAAKYHGIEATFKKSWDKITFVAISYARQYATSNGPALSATNPYLLSGVPWTNDVLSASIPRDSASLLYSQGLADGYSYSAAYYFQSSLKPFDRGITDYQPTQHRVDLRIAKHFHASGRVNGEVALVVQQAFNTVYTEYIASNAFNRRAFVSLTLHE